MSKRDKYNSSGCLDMTAYLAIRNVEREEKIKRTADRERGKGHLTRRRRTDHETADAYKLMFRDYPDVVNVEQLCRMLGGISSKTAYRLLKTSAIM